MAEAFPNVYDHSLPQPEEPSSDDDEPEEETTYIVPKGPGRFVFCNAYLASAARNFEAGNAQYECNLIANRNGPGNGCP